MTWSDVGKEDEWETNESVIRAIGGTNCTAIGSYAFANCVSLSEASFQACTDLGEKAFAGCDSLTSLYISNSMLKTIDNGYGTPNQLVIYAFAENTVILAVGGIQRAFNSACTAIYGRAFYYCKSLTTASFPNCRTISGYTFYGCSRLTEVSFPACFQVNEEAFGMCTSLSVASFPACANIGPMAFAGCYHLVSLYLTGSSVCSLNPEDVFDSTPIGGYSAVTGCYGSIYVPSSLLTSYQNATNWSYFSSRFVGV